MTTDTPEVTRVYWNDPAILEAAGTSPENVRALMQRQGQPLPTPTAIYQWASRRKIAEPWRAPLLFALFMEQRIEVRNLFRRSSPYRMPSDKARAERLQAEAEGQLPLPLGLADE